MAARDAPEESLARRTRRLLAELGRPPSKARGQSFLIDAAIAQRVADFVCEGARRKVLEIGAGLGALTEPLAACCEELVALEIEPAFSGALQGLLGERPHVRVVVADALRADLGALCGGGRGEWRVVGNLPYATATAILLRLLTEGPGWERIVATVQREVGARLLAAPGDSAYGSLSVAAAYYLRERQAVARVPRGAFHPQPKVDSSVLALTPRASPLVEPALEALTFAVVRAGFGQRRKKLANALASAPPLALTDRARAAELLARAELPANARAEELSLDEFLRLARVMGESGVDVGGAR